MAHEVSYRQVGREKSYAPPPRLRDDRTKRSHEHDAFGNRTERFSKLTNDIPPPGAYFRRSTLERDGRVCGSVSAKGYGTGFVSATPRFKDLKRLQQAFLPGPGSYSTHSEAGQERGKLTSFSTLKRDCGFSPDALAAGPGPGEYDIDGVNKDTGHKHRAGLATPTSSFLCSRTPINVGTNQATPAPGTYDLHRAQHTRIDKNGNVLKDPFFRSQTKRIASFIVASDVPGPGEYDVDRDMAAAKEGLGPGGNRSCGRNGRPGQQPRGGGGNTMEKEDVTPGPGWYTPHQTKPVERLPSTFSIFRSATKRFAERGGAEAPGPAFYQPEPLGKKSFRWNAKKQWI